MKAIKYLISIAFFITIFVSAQAQNFKEIDRLLRRYNYKAATEKLAEYEREAWQNNDCDVLLQVYKYLRVIAYVNDTLGRYLGNLERKAHKFTPPCKNLFYLSLARAYRDYYNHNKHRILTRAKLPKRPADIRGWSAEDFAEKIDRLYDLALSGESLLKKTQYDYCPSVIEPGELPAPTRPTLYDLIAFYAIDYYKDPTIQVTNPLPGINLKDREWYLPPEKFARVKIKPYSRRDYNYKILRLYQKLTLFHLNDKNPDALLHTTFERLKYLTGRNGLEYSYKPVRKTLLALMDKYSGTVYEQQAKLKLAELEFQKGDYIVADSLVNEIIAYYKKEFEGKIEQYPTAQSALKLKEYIERPELDLAAERNVIPHQNFPVLLKVRNIPRLYYKVYKIKFSDYRREKDYSYYSRLKPVRTGVIDLPQVERFKGFSTEYIMQGLDPGLYVISVTNLEEGKRKIVKLFYVNATYITGVKIIPFNSKLVIYEFLNRENGRYLTRLDDSAKSVISPKGRVLVPRCKLVNDDWMYESDDFLIRVSGNSSEFWFKPEVDCYDNEYHFYDIQYFKIFLDRKIYRPGQTVYFKVLVYSYNDDTLKLKPNKDITLSIRDPKDNTIKNIKLKTDKYGTASGNFVIPQGRLTGRWKIVVPYYYGREYFRVEEYKRPKFEIKFTPPENDILIGQTIILTGRAASYSGVGLSNAEVKYIITAQTFNPYKRRWNSAGREQITIKHGTVKTDNQGNFTIKFKAKDIAPEKDLPVRYKVDVTVTDINGETQTKTYTVRAGKKAVYPAIYLPNKITTTQKQLRVFIRGISGKPLTNLSGLLEIYSLVYPADHPLISRKWSAPSKPMYTLEQWRELLPYYAYKDENKLQNLKTGSLILQKTVSDNDTVTLDLTPGLYKAILTVKDPVTGKEVQTVSYTTVYDLNANKPPYPEKLYLLVEKEEIVRGEPLRFVVGTGFKDVWLHYRVEERKHVIVDTAIKLSGEQRWITVNLDSSVKHGIHITCYLQAQNRFFKQEKTVRIKKLSRKLDFKLETFRDRLVPGEQEEWTVTVLRQRDGRPADAQVLASMYDASLDVFARNRWKFAPPEPKVFYSKINSVKNNAYWAEGVFDVPRGKYRPLKPLRLNFYIDYGPYIEIYDDLFFEDVEYNNVEKTDRHKALPSLQQKPEAQTLELKDFAIVDQGEKTMQEPEIKVRENFAETAFFYPHLHTDGQGRIVIKFTVPESLTRWNFQMFAIDTLFDYGLFFKEVITSQEFSIEPNEPRFLRQGDTLYFTAKVTNLTGSEQTVKASLVFTGATGQDTINIIADRMIKTVKVPPKSSARVSWRVIVPEDLTGPVIYTVKAYNDKVSDGERNIIPVLSNSILVTETLPLPVKAHEQKTFVLENLVNYDPQTMTNYQLILEFNTNPAWYAITAMPYLMKYPYECNEQLFSRFYANALSSYIVMTNPEFKQAFDKWREGGLLRQGNLKKAQWINPVILQETPWQSRLGSRYWGRARLALLFDLNKMASEKEAALTQLLKRQNSDGGWGWWPGYYSDWFMTQHIMTGLIKLDSKGIISVRSDKRLFTALEKASRYLDRVYSDYYRTLTARNQRFDTISIVGRRVADYLYLREFLKRYNFDMQGDNEAISFFEDMVNRYWSKQNLYTLATEALYFYEKGDKARADSAIALLRKQATISEDKGMYWKNNRAGWRWYQAPIETQARIIEAFAKITNDRHAINLMKLWLLNSRKSNSWGTTKATTEATYALLFYGGNWFVDNEPVEITVGNYKLPDKADSIAIKTGYLKHVWTGEEITKSMATIRVNNPNNYNAFGLVYWQYYKDVDKVAEYRNNDLKLTKQYFIERNTSRGKKLLPVTASTPVHVGDIVVVRLVLEADRDMDYVHLKDMRPTGFEPVNQLSGYRRKGGVDYYMAQKDASTNFFISHLYPGKYVFEYRLKATVAGSFSTGISTLQCMYAPEFNVHTTGQRIVVKD